jgi:alkanesulfonate monooxygenase SsuD/methylene tetrahydromethanopterin reductase-like flavin-dependent oxidoreductase (luciferase family)
LNVSRSPQNGPAIIQAGASERGRAFAAKHADAIFAIQPFVEGASALYTAIKSRVENEGRNPDDCKILFSVQPFVAETEQEAREKQALHNSLVPPEAGLAILSGHLGYDFSQLGLDDIVEHYEVPGSQGIVDMYTKVAGKKVTVSEIAQMHGRAVGGLQMVGNPEQVADQLEAYFQQAGGDGFMIVAGDRPGTLRDFVELVVPVLQRRGLFRKDYAGTTLREHLREN